ncbi:MAG TPA: SMP-30/gluconolactonase/LRE family protein [Flavobacteriales bacterium]|nr:SMP-30/gluconolactonase/LRE family protein [Flavobacteriales bacterium]
MKPFASAFVAAMLPIALHAQQVTTILDAATQVDDALFRDADGYLYGSHYMGSNVYRLAPDGAVATFISGLDTPNGIAMNSAGEFYVADNTGDRILHVAHDGSPIDTFAVTNPSGLLKAWDSDTILFTQYLPGKMGKLAPDGVISTTHEGLPLNGPVGLAYTEDGTLYVANYTDRRIHRVTTSGLEYVARVPGPSNGVLGFITAAGNRLYGTSWNNNAIYAIEPMTVDSVRLVAGGNGPGNTDGDASVARFNQPNGILAVAGGDTLYVSDFGSKNIRMITGVLTGIHVRDRDEQLRVGPNPVREVVRVHADEPWPAGTRCEVIDAQGRMAHQRTELVPVQHISVDVRDLAPGAYVVRLISPGRSASAHIVVE